MAQTLTEDFWNQEAEAQKAEAASDNPNSNNDTFWDRIETFLDAATAKADFLELPESCRERETIRNAQDILNETNAWFENRKEYRANASIEQQIEEGGCPVTYNLELHSLVSVKGMLAELGLIAIAEGQVNYAMQLAMITEILSTIERRFKEKVPDSWKTLPELSFGQIHSAISRSLPEAYWCPVFANTDEPASRLETLSKRISRMLEIDTEEYPINRW